MNTKNLKIGTTIVTILGLGVNLALNWLEEKEREVMKQDQRRNYNGTQFRKRG